MEISRRRIDDLRGPCTYFYEKISISTNPTYPIIYPLSERLGFVELPLPLELQDRGVEAVQGEQLPRLGARGPCGSECDNSYIVVQAANFFQES